MSAPHRRNSFSYKAIDQRIRDILDERSILDNTVQVAMPFIKVTSTIDLGKIAGYALENSNNYGFTLGIHAIEEELEYIDMYSESGTGEYLIGYTYTSDGKSKSIYTPAIDNIRNGIFTLIDNSINLANTESFSFIPPPGITSVNVGRNRNGVISIADVKFSVPTLYQLEALHRTFLIPGVGMIVEWGQQFAPKKRKSYGELGIEPFNIERHMFPWYNRQKLEVMLDRLSKQQVGLEEILNDYVYPTQGQYQWMYGKVANFSINANSDGSFECSVKIVGPSEDSFAYSTRNTVVPPKIRGTSNCISKSNSVEAYFTKTVAGKNLKTLLEAVDSDEPPSGLSNWKGHVIKFEKPRDVLSTSGRDTNTPSSGEDTRAVRRQLSEQDFADSENAYFMTWRFFVNIVLNDEEYGLKSIFKDAAYTDDELKKVSLLRPYTNPGTTPRESSMPDGKFEIIDPYENFVGNNKYLRSTDPSTLIIVNEFAATEASNEVQRRSVSAESTIHPTIETIAMLDMGDFYESAVNVEDPTRSNSGENDRGFLSTGVWINHKAVVQVMASSNTILAGITNLLNRMNSATNNYWNLSIDPSEPEIDSVGDSVIYLNYGIVDTNYAESSEYATNKFLGEVHLFNKYIRRDDNTLVGSEVIDANISLDLPKLLFSQIATIGLHQEGDMGVLNGQVDEELADHPKIPGAMEQLRQMFSITSLAQTDEFDRGPDLTQLSAAGRKELIDSIVCGDSDGQTTANTSGRGSATTIQDRLVAGRILQVDGYDNQTEYAREQLARHEKILEFCNEYCQTTEDDPTTSPLTDNRLVSQLTIGEIKNRQSNRYMFAVGKYQITPDTLLEAQGALGISDGTIFSPDVQERFGDYLLFQKRPVLGRYLNGQTDDLYTAQLQLAQEFASLSVPAGINVPLSGSITRNVSPEDSVSYYAGDSAGNTSKVTAGEVANVLVRARQSNNVNILKNFISDRESAIDRYNALNVLPVRGREFFTLLVGTEDYKRAINNLPYIGTGRVTSRQRINYSSEAIDRTDDMEWPYPEGDRLANSTKFECRTCGNNTLLKNGYERWLENESEVISSRERVLSKNPQLENAFRYIEILPDWMVTQITNNSNNVLSNSFGAAPGALSIGGDIVLPGINGLRIGELFWIDRIPAFYKAFGAFQIISLEDNIGQDGWTTKIHARFNYLGSAWVGAMSKLLSGG